MKFKKFSMSPTVVSTVNKATWMNMSMWCHCRIPSKAALTLWLHHKLIVSSSWFKTEWSLVVIAAIAGTRQGRSWLLFPFGIFWDYKWWGLWHNTRSTCWDPDMELWWTHCNAPISLSILMPCTLQNLLKRSNSSAFSKGSAPGMRPGTIT